MPKQFPFSFVSLPKDYNLDLNFIDILEKIKIENLSNFYRNTGINSTFRPTNIPFIEKAETETVYSSEKTNAFIILGNDRPNGLGSGYGGEGHSGAAAIDIVVGSSGTKPVRKLEENICLTNKNFRSDASRVYISQKANIDEYLGLDTRAVVGVLGKNFRTDNSTGKAAIALVTDCIRLAARESVKITTTHLGLNSNNNDVDIGGIDIIAGHDVDDKRHELQPLVKGNNLIKCLDKILQLIELLQTTVKTLNENQSKINDVLINHKHTCATAGGVSDTLIAKESLFGLNKAFLEQTTKNLVAAKIDLGIIILENLKPSGKDYINSFYNRVN